MALEARATTATKGVLLDSFESASSKCLDNMAVQMIAYPAVAELLGVGVQVVFAKAHGSISLAEGADASFCLA